MSNAKTIIDQNGEFQPNVVLAKFPRVQGVVSETPAALGRSHPGDPHGVRSRGERSNQFGGTRHCVGGIRSYLPPPWLELVQGTRSCKQVVVTVVPRAAEGGRRGRAGAALGARAHADGVVGGGAQALQHRLAARRRARRRRARRAAPRCGSDTLTALASLSVLTRMF